MKKIRLSKLIPFLILIAFLISLGASFYFFRVAQIREDKSFINSSARKKDNPLYVYEQYFDSLEKTTLQINQKHEFILSLNLQTFHCSIACNYDAITICNGNW